MHYFILCKWVFYLHGRLLHPCAQHPTEAGRGSFFVMTLSVIPGLERLKRALQKMDDMSSSPPYAAEYLSKHNPSEL